MSQKDLIGENPNLGAVQKQALCQMGFSSVTHLAEAIADAEQRGVLLNAIQLPASGERDAIFKTVRVGCDSGAQRQRIRLVADHLPGELLLLRLTIQLFESSPELLLVTADLASQSLELVSSSRQLRKRDVCDLAPDARAVVTGGERAVEDARQGVIVASRDGIELVIVTSST